jgi:small subunit ribosomal protein S6
MNKYETLILLSPELASEERQEVLDTLTGVITRENGKMIEVDDWGVRDLAYPVRKQVRGYYVRLEYAGPGKLVSELERIIRINDGVFKFLSVKLDEGVESEEAV